MHIYRMKLLYVAMGIVVLFQSNGCSRPAEDLAPTAPVSGTVTYQGQPLARARLMFYPENGMKPASGTTDDNGAYSALTTFKTGDGAVLGDHTVTVVRYGETAAGEVSMKSLISEKYTDPARSPLKVTIQDGENDIPITLDD